MNKCHLLRCQTKFKSVNVAPAPAVPAPEPVLAAPVAQVENWLPAAVENAAPEVTIPNRLIPSLFQLV